MIFPILKGLIWKEAQSTMSHIQVMESIAPPGNQIPCLRSVQAVSDRPWSNASFPVRRKNKTSSLKITSYTAKVENMCNPFINRGKNRRDATVQSKSTKLKTKIMRTYSSLFRNNASKTSTNRSLSKHRRSISRVELARRKMIHESSAALLTNYDQIFILIFRNIII